MTESARRLRLFECSDGSRTLIVERLILGEIGIRSVQCPPAYTAERSNGVILSEDDRLGLLRALRGSECVVDSCGDSANYAGAYRLGDRKIILHFCEQHFDETNDRRLDFAPDSSDVRAALWHQVAETLAAALTRHGSSFDALRAYEEAKALDV